MAQVAEYQASQIDAETAQTQEKIARFLEHLTRLSLQCGIGITGKPVLFMMEPNDYERAYKIDDDSNLSFD